MRNGDLNNNMINMKHGYMGYNDIMGYNGISWDIMGYNGIYIMGYNGISWDIMGYNGI